MAKKIISWKIIAILVIALGLGFYDLPGETQQKILPFVPDSFSETQVHLGLDLQGGSQLDYKIDLRKVPASDQAGIIDGVREVIERRVNSLGVSEPNIYVSDVAGETHIMVELAENGIISQEDADKYLGEIKPIAELNDDEIKLVSLEKAKATVGKTIQLEFKEQKAEADPAELDGIREDAEKALNRIKNGEIYSVVAQEEEQAFPGKVRYDKSEFLFAEDIPQSINSAIANLEPGQYASEIVETGESFVINAQGQAVQETGLAVVKLVEKKEEVKAEKQVATSHILISFVGADSASASVTRTEAEAEELAKEVKTKIEGGEEFATVAKEYSDDSSNKETGGILSTPVTGEGTYVFDFEQAALALETQGQLSDIVKTQFGFHIIKANDIKENVTETKYQYETITYSTIPDQWDETGLTGKNFVHADVQIDNLFQPYISIQFDDEGAKLFEDITAKNIGKPIAIFVGGDLISAPTVQAKIAGGQAQITGSFTNDEAQALARDLNTGAIPAPIILTGEYTIGATLGHEALSTSLKAGMLGLILVMIFMIAYYKLAGLVADTALLIYAAILIFLIKSQLHLGIALALSLGIFTFIILKILNNQDSGWEKFMSFILSLFAFFFMTFLLKTGVVLTLAGVAGLILSIGMAVDANILIFERFKEEIQNGNTFNTAVERGFDRAWTAIRDSNFSTLLTCAILFYFGSSIIKGFAFNLAAGVLVSMFSAITITRTLMKGFVGKKLAENPRLFGASTREKTWAGFKFMKNSKLWLSISGGLVAISIIAITTFGLNLGIDFKGGTLMEFKFSEPITKELLANSLIDIEKEFNAGNIPTTKTEEIAVEEVITTDSVVAVETTESAEPIAATESSSVDSPIITQNPEAILDTTIDLTRVTILAAEDNNYIVKTKYLTSEQHEIVVSMMKETLPSFTEPRFTTIGPVIGSTLLQKAMIAIVVALIMIIAYIGFAFRKIPKYVSPWRFGISAIAALAHDVIIVTGIFAILGYYLSVEIDALFITAMLTVFGYSVNDTIVIFDRIRENLLNSHDNDLERITDDSLNQTIARSINTSFSTMIALIAVLIWGSPSIFYFILALTLGTAVGTYSSILVASPIMVKWNNWVRRDK